MCENPFFELVGAKGYPDSSRSARVDNEFDQFKNKHDRKYKNEVEEAQRKTHFRHNYRLGRSNKIHSFWLGDLCDNVPAG